MRDFDIRVLDESYWSDVYDLIRPFYDEGHWSDNGEFSPENTSRYILEMLYGSHVLGAFRPDEDALVAIASCEICYEFHVRPEAYVTNFYSQKSVRGTGVGRKMVEAIIAFCKENNCGNIYAANTGEFSVRANALHDNLFAKYGFVVVSRNLRKVL